MLIETDLNLSVDYIVNNGIDFSHVHDDGRINSAIDEEAVVRACDRATCSGHTVFQEKRSYCDIKIANEPVNIKITKMGVDNLSSKEGLIYALTGKEYQALTWKQFDDCIVSLPFSPTSDYYYLIIDKEDITKSFWTSLKRLNKLIPNGNNLPFQCNWALEQRLGQNIKTNDEAIKMILTTLYDSHMKRMTSSQSVLNVVESRLNSLVRK